MDPTDAVLVRVGRRIAELREKRAWTQEEFAEKAACSVKYVQSVERGDENLTIRTMVKLAGVLGSSVDQLFEQPKAAKRKPGRPRSTSIKRQ